MLKAQAGRSGRPVDPAGITSLKGVSPLESILRPPMRAPGRAA